MTEPLPDWAVWQRSAPYTLGAEEEVMLLDPADWSLAQRADDVMAELPEELDGKVDSETQGAVLELTSAPHRDVAGLSAELIGLREALEGELATLGLRAASAGTHPSTVWQETVVSSADRYQEVYGSMRELARREPTFALHVHVGVADPEQAIRLVNSMRGYLPLLLALSVNSPFWQGRDTGLASARTPLFQAFPRVGIPRRFDGFADWVETVALLIDCGAFPEPTFLWWDVRPQPRFGTVEVRILDAQGTVGETAALCALVQSLARLEIEQGYVSEELISRVEVLDENRFIAARDGMDARLIDPRLGRRVPAREQLAALLEACAPHAAALGCTAELASIEPLLMRRTGADRQVQVARASEKRLPGLVAAMADAFCEDPWDRPKGETPGRDFGHLARGGRDMRA